MNSRRLIFFFSLFSVLVCKAQFRDTLHEIFTHKSSIDARLETRYSLINNEIISVSGFRLGVAFQRKMRIGGGLSWIKSDYQRVFYVDSAGREIGKSISFLKFGYMCFYLDFVFHKTKRWQLSVPIQAGAGLSWYQPKADLYLFGGDKKRFLLLYEPGITVQYKIFRWFGVGSDVAYRFVVKNKYIHEHLNSPTYSLKLLIWFDQLYYVAFPKSKLSQKRGPAVW